MARKNRAAINEDLFDVEQEIQIVKTKKHRLTEEQLKVIDSLYEYPITFVNGTWGTGKTFSCIYGAIQLLKDKKVSKIVVTRPFIPDKGLGALPGSIEEKLIFEMQPILDNFYEIITQNEVEKMMKEGTLKLQYNGKIKGITVQDAVFVCDETQDMDYTDFLQLLTRLGKNSKMICTLSSDQIHRSIAQNSCYYILDCLREYQKVGWVDLIQNHRHGIIRDIVDYIKDMKGV